ncbi:site-specific recombinase, phage integrase domain protein [Leptospira borgpetersenii serovar Ballum]|uniref:Site-specific recombinase, phage integrase domain protein n=1 Tax=Leptospira borgpetersenii serovar Ballum TaxID=280505 RepID=A0A0S2INN5_LEPBO|nr:site-specific recombinase, phage integrase domain protein [Leptospira borgpetersenii serovar Ballum]ANH00236.2 Site-specific recombinase, phage integrase domain protein [Leptospira borgpetersenii str. 4E]
MSIRSNVINIKEYQNRRTNVPRRSNPETGLMLGKGLTDQSVIELSKRFSNPITERDFRNRAFFTLMSQTGLRAKEIISLRFSQLFYAPSGEMLRAGLKT